MCIGTLTVFPLSYFRCCSHINRVGHALTLCLLSTEQEPPKPVTETEKHSTMNHDPGATDYHTVLQQLQQQIEFYLSPGNLNRDVHLQSLLAEHGGAPLCILASWPKVQKIYHGCCGSICEPIEIALCRALEHSAVVYVSEDGKIRLRNVVSGGGGGGGVHNNEVGTISQIGGAKEAADQSNKPGDATAATADTTTPTSFVTTESMASSRPAEDTKSSKNRNGNNESGKGITMQHPYFAPVVVPHHQQQATVSQPNDTHHYNFVNSVQPYHQATMYQQGQPPYHEYARYHGPYSSSHQNYDGRQLHQLDHNYQSEQRHAYEQFPLAYAPASSPAQFQQPLNIEGNETNHSSNNNAKNASHGHYQQGMSAYGYRTAAAYHVFPVQQQHQAPPMMMQGMVADMSGMYYSSFPAEAYCYQPDFNSVADYSAYHQADMSTITVPDQVFVEGGDDLFEEASIQQLEQSEKPAKVTKKSRDGEVLTKPSGNKTALRDDKKKKAHKIEPSSKQQYSSQQNLHHSQIVGGENQQRKHKKKKKSHKNYHGDDEGLHNLDRHGKHSKKLIQECDRSQDQLPNQGQHREKYRVPREE
jgi:hypothetical protein